MNSPDVYPSEPVKVRKFSYKSDLHLTRKIQAVKNRNKSDADYVVAKDFRAVVEIGKSPEISEEHQILVPEFMVTDLASIPFVFRWFVSRVGPHLEACIIHDWLYVAWQVKNLPNNKIMRKFADDVLHAAMREANVNKFKYWLIYLAVRIFGGFSFNKERKVVFVEQIMRNSRQV